MVPIGVVLHLPPVRWERERVKQWVESCRKQSGIPIFKTRFAGERFEFQGKPAVMGTCFGGTGPEISVQFIGVPEKVVEFIEAATGTWKRLPVLFEKEEV